MARPAVFGSCQRAAPLYTAYTAGVPTPRVPNFNLSLRAQRGNLVTVAMVVCRRVFNLNEIATPLDKLGMILRRAQDERKILAMTVGKFGLTKWVCVTGSDCPAAG